ncbi:hypothetical protein GCM10027280_05280 [Micromonospora polyrhachis]|uniref:WD40-like Beta Propeller Repeat n=1 Tax=Micromonospora polyrhachis TaxID=1282883 RepID=A0A7W7SKP0_9ACTN|nr:hypothetical protein [Micromonospora polyrhachis]MBB4956563.1 hypothetical protein [Micromonospora polyrhachis]
MTSRLTEAVRESVAGVRSYVSYEGLVAEAGRRRRRAFVAAGVVLVLLLGVVVAPWLPGWRDESGPVGTAVEAAGDLSLPDRAGTPQWGGWSVQRRPLGAASMIFTAENWWYEPPSMGTVAVVSAGTDDYRRFSSNWAVRAGEDALLSGDGNLVATPEQLTDLRTGKTYRLPAIGGAEDTFPVAWSRDGGRLAVVGLDGRYVRQRNGDEVYTLTRAVLAVWELATKRITTVIGIDARTVFHGWLAAFSPDGRFLAYQSGRTVAVVAVGGAVRSQFTVPEDTQLAGKGAWTPDGRGLTLVTQRRCCTGDAYPARWQLRMVDPSTGAGLVTTPFAEQPGLVALRLLGWAPDGAAVVARYHPRTDAEVARYYPRADGEVVGFGVRDGITYGGWTEYRTDVVALTGNGLRVLLTGTGEQVHGVDIADDVIASGRTHPGKLPPDGMGPEYRMYLKIAGLVLVAVLLIIGILPISLIIYLRRSRRRPVRTA